MNPGGGGLNGSVHLTFDLLAFLTGIAFVAGLIDALAGGGGLLTLPALMGAGIPPVAAIATNKLQSTLGTGGAFLAFARRGHVDFRRFAPHALAVFAGACLGAFTLQHVAPTFLKGLMPALLIAMALYFLLAPPMREADRHARMGLGGLALIAAVIGFYDGFFGPGTGSFFTTALVALGGLGLVRAIAHAKFFNFASNVAALGILILGGKVMWLPGLTMAIASVAGNQAGAHLAMRFGGRGVRPLLVLMSLALTARLLADPANPLRLWLGY